VKKIYGLIFAAILFFSISPGELFAMPDEDVVIKYNGIALESEELMKNIIINEGRTLVPVRLLSETLGYKVEWHEKTKEIAIQNGKKKIGLQVGVPGAILDGIYSIDEKLDIQPAIIENTTYVPIRFISETLGCLVNYEKYADGANVISLFEKESLRKEAFHLFLGYADTFNSNHTEKQIVLESDERAFSPRFASAPSIKGNFPLTYSIDMVYLIENFQCKDSPEQFIFNEVELTVTHNIDGLSSLNLTPLDHYYYGAVLPKISFSNEEKRDFIKNWDARNYYSYNDIVIFARDALDFLEDAFLFANYHTDPADFETLVAGYPNESFDNSGGFTDFLNMPFNNEPYLHVVDSESTQDILRLTLIAYSTITTPHPVAAFTVDLLKNETNYIITTLDDIVIYNDFVDLKNRAPSLYENVAFIKNTAPLY